jgi:hypothetical protein
VNELNQVSCAAKIQRPTQNILTAGKTSQRKALPHTTAQNALARTVPYLYIYPSLQLIDNISVTLILYSQLLSCSSFERQMCLVTALKAYMVWYLFLEVLRNSRIWPLLHKPISLSAPERKMRGVRAFFSFQIITSRRLNLVPVLSTLTTLAPHSATRIQSKL